MAELDKLLVYLKETGGSDLHLATGLEPRIRRHGSLEPVEGWTTLDAARMTALLSGITTPKQWDEYDRTRDLDFAYGLEGVARFRANYLYQENGPGAVFRIIPEKIVALEDLKLPAAVEKLAHMTQGLVLVTGPTGSGKSTTLASIIDTINTTYSRHIVTIEDPIEFVHQNRKSVVSHREVGTHTNSFAPALRAAVREDADVVLVGEMRDLETISMAITAAEMGVLVFGTLHTNNCAKTIDRIIDAFPADQQEQVRVTLSESIAAILSQLLIPAADGKGRHAAIELLMRTQGLPNIIREGNTPMLYSVIQSGKKDGMQTMDEALMAHLQAGRISHHDALARAQDKTKFEKPGEPQGAPAAPPATPKAA
ncbi:MAG TPA: PilT/PilU family type 4a pilus ATPase [Candidatus Polarisedimenticolia bacterium]|nr:PilT/PilU family type 4a pilus ATPase [Candidatus Polarisedimenticolia bacterium]